MAVYWRDSTRSETDWTWVSLLLDDQPDAWSWLAVAAITRQIKVDVLVNHEPGELELARAAIVTLDAEFVKSWLDRFPEPPAYVTQGLAGIVERHIVGGLQAAERSKSYDILELTQDEGGDRALLEARRDVLSAESERADRVWALREGDDSEVRRSWDRLRELRSWKHGRAVDTRIDPDDWLRELTQDVATDKRAIVHMMVGDGLELFWAAEAGSRRDAVATPVPVYDLLAALEPWAENESLRPSSDRDPVARMFAAAAPVADALADLASSEGFEHLVLVPWRALHSVPWAALNLTDGSALREHVRVTHAPAIRMLRSSYVPKSDVDAVAVIAAHGGTLPRADAEVDIVAHLREGTRYPDGTSSAEIVRAMSAAEVVHVVGHAESGPHPFAAAVLAGRLPATPSQITSAARVHADADLSACRLVMVNTCNSGRYAPRSRSFENHTGFDTACLCAGAVVVISTLWPVNDLVATLVAAMTHWHLALGEPPHVALENAVSLIRDEQGSAGVPADLRTLLDTKLGVEWREKIDTSRVALSHPYWWAAWRISGADWLLDDLP